MCILQAKIWNYGMLTEKDFIKDWNRMLIKDEKEDVIQDENVKNKWRYQRWKWIISMLMQMRRYVPGGNGSGLESPWMATVLDLFLHRISKGNSFYESFMSGWCSPIPERWWFSDPPARRHYTPNSPLNGRHVSSRTPRGETARDYNWFVVCWRQIAYIHWCHLLLNWFKTYFYDWISWSSCSEHKSIE